MSKAGGQIAAQGPAALVTSIHFPNLVWSTISETHHPVAGGKEDNEFKKGL